MKTVLVLLLCATLLTALNAQLDCIPIPGWNPRKIRCLTSEECTEISCTYDQVPTCTFSSNFGECECLDLFPKRYSEQYPPQLNPSQQYLPLQDPSQQYHQYYLLPQFQPPQNSPQPYPPKFYTPKHDHYPPNTYSYPSGPFYPYYPKPHPKLSPSGLYVSGPFYPTSPSKTYFSGLHPPASYNTLTRPPVFYPML